AGRFGNLGQTDYSAANEYLAKAVKAEAVRRRSLVGSTIAWGPWGEVGMATKGSILQIMHASGVTPIPTSTGVAMFLRELAQPGVFGLEAFAEAGLLLAPKDAVFLGADDVRFALPLKQLKAASAKGKVSAKVTSKPDAPTTVLHCTLTSQFTGPDGRPVGEP